MPPSLPPCARDSCMSLFQGNRGVGAPKGSTPVLPVLSVSRWGGGLPRLSCGPKAAWASARTRPPEPSEAAPDSSGRKVGTATWSWDGRWQCPTTSSPCLSVLGSLPSPKSGQAGARWQREGTAKTQVPTMYCPGGPSTGPDSWWAVGQCQGQLRSLLLHGSTSGRWEGLAWCWCWCSEEAAEDIPGQSRAPWWRAQLPALRYSLGLGAVVPCATSRRWGGPHSDGVLVAGEAAELLPQGLEAGPLLRVPVPAREHQPVGTGRALGGAGHAVARVHPREGLVVGHACGEGTGRLGGQCPPAAVPPRKPWPRSHPLHLPPISWARPLGSTQGLRMVSRLQVQGDGSFPHCLGPVPG